MSKLKRVGLLLIVVIACSVLFGLLSPQTSASSANISHSYLSNDNIQTGSLVSLDSNHSGYIVPANTSNGNQLIGVTVAAGNSIIAIHSNTGSTNTFQVATSGNAAVLVSTLNGNIAVGNQVSISPFNGVGIKALPNSRIIGVAQTSFNSHVTGATTERITDTSGQSNTISVGYIELSIAIGNSSATTGNGGLSSLQKDIYNLTGHVVSSLRIGIGLVVAIMACLALVTLIYASIYASIISVGRNPLAKSPIFQSLRSVLVLAVLTAVVASLTIFLLLD
jgi:hypothetical protein